jgi:NAD(P)-dependent dehydrogenase (short-subunit alcohol dehydrogenase family)
LYAREESGMAQPLAGKVAVVTGASAGIGRATALALARAGARVLVTARRAERLEALAQEIRAAGGEAVAVPGDIARREHVRIVIGSAIERLGRLDILVNNAGLGHYAPLAETPPEVFQYLWDVNVMGMVHGIQEALPFMRQQGRGHIINVSSVAGKQGGSGHSAYNATKFAQIGISEALRLELWKSGISVSVVCPVVTDTEFFDVVARRSSGRRPRFAGPVQTAEHVARCILRCIRRPRPEVFPFALARIYTVLGAISPRLAGRLFIIAQGAKVAPPAP